MAYNQIKTTNTRRFKGRWAEDSHKAATANQMAARLAQQMSPPKEHRNSWLLRHRGVMSRISLPFIVLSGFLFAHNMVLSIAGMLIFGGANILLNVWIHRDSS